MFLIHSLGALRLRSCLNRFRVVNKVCVVKLVREFPKVFHVSLISSCLRPLERLEIHRETMRVVVFGLTFFRNLL